MSECLCRTRAPTLTCASISGDGGDTSLVGWWKLDECGGTSAADSSGNSNTGTLRNSPTWTAGRSGNTLAFNGSNQYLSIADSASLQLGGTNILTLAAWVKRGTASATGGVIQKCTTTGGYTLSIGVTPCAANQIKATKFGVVDICLGSVPADTSWHHLALVFSSTGVVDYIDGVRDATYAGSQDFVSNADVTTIGVNLVNSVYFNGAIDDVRIYKRALSAADIMALAQ